MGPTAPRHMTIRPGAAFTCVLGAGPVAIVEDPPDDTKERLTVAVGDYVAGGPDRMTFILPRPVPADGAGARPGRGSATAKARPAP